MTGGALQRELVDAAPVLQALIDGASITERSANESVLGTEVHTVITDVAIAAYKAGVAATILASRHYEDIEYAGARLTFRADLAAIDLKDRDRLTTHAPEVTALLDSTPSYIPFNGEKCLPEGGFTEEHHRSQDEMTKSLVANFKFCDDTALAAIAAEMGFKYGRSLQSEGVTGEGLLHRVKAFEVKQLMIIRKSTETNMLRQPDQDDHAFEHYLDDLFRACMPVWAALSNRPKPRRF